MAEDGFIKSLSFVMSSKNRQTIIRSLTKPSTPTAIHQKTKINIKLVSRALGDLSKAGLVECKTPDARKGRIYALTKEGEKVAEHFKE